jgi:hypothetical protein
MGAAYQLDGRQVVSPRNPSRLLGGAAALLAFGYLFGFVGLLVAVPLAATIGVLARFVLRRYLQSSFYTSKPD